MDVAAPQPISDFRKRKSDQLAMRAMRVARPAFRRGLVERASGEEECRKVVLVARPSWGEPSFGWLKKETKGELQLFRIPHFHTYPERA